MPDGENVREALREMRAADGARAAEVFLHQGLDAVVDPEMRAEAQYAVEQAKARAGKQAKGLGMAGALELFARIGWVIVDAQERAQREAERMPKTLLGYPVQVVEGAEATALVEPGALAFGDLRCYMDPRCYIKVGGGSE